MNKHVKSLVIINALVSALLVTACDSGGGSEDSPQNFPRFAYAVNYSDSTISMYTVNAETGQLRHNGYVLMDTGACAVALHPSGRFLYTANYGADNTNPDTVSMYMIDRSSGALAPGTPVSVESGINTRSIAVDPSGRFAYAADRGVDADSGPDTISMYTIDLDTGALTPCATPTIAAGNQPVSVAVHPSGKFAYAANYGSGSDSGNDTVSIYRIDRETGALSPAATASATAGDKPHCIAFHPSGEFAYVANAGSGSVSVFTVNRNTGALTPASPASVDAGTFTIYVTVDPSGKFVYAANRDSSSISAYAIDPDSGSLTPAGADAATGSLPLSATVDPSGKFVYAPCQGSNTVSAYEIDRDSGALAPAGTCSARNIPFMLAVSSGTSPIKHVPKFAYVANETTDTVSMYSINPNNGALSLASSVSIPDTTGFPCAVAADTRGRFAYVPSDGLTSVDPVYIYRIDQSSGELISGTQVSADAEDGAVSSVVEPSGRFAYVANFHSSSIGVYSINQSTGALSPGGAAATGSTPWTITIDPSGRFVYVASWGATYISAYTVDPVDGSLAPAAAVDVGHGAWSVAVDPSGRFAYVADGSADVISVYTINQSNGSLSPGAEVAAWNNPYSIAVDPSGRFVYTAGSSGNVCMYTIDQATGGLEEGSADDTNSASYSLTVDVSGRFVYAVNTYSEDISVFTIDQATGFLTPGAAAEAGGNPRSIITIGTIE